MKETKTKNTRARASRCCWKPSWRKRQRWKSGSRLGLATGWLLVPRRLPARIRPAAHLERLDLICTKMGRVEERWQLSGEAREPNL